MNRSMPAFWIRSNRSNRWAGVPNEILNFMSNVPDQRPRASDARYGTDASSRGSLHPACWAKNRVHSMCSFLTYDEMVKQKCNCRDENEKPRQQTDKCEEVGKVCPDLPIDL
jgi:hypothetical protein